jgi:hypothetical protein
VKTNSFVAGVPAKAVIDDIRAPQEAPDRYRRITEIIELFRTEEPEKAKTVKFVSSWREISEVDFNVADLPPPAGGLGKANWFSFSDNVGRHSDPRFWHSWTKVLGYYAVRARMFGSADAAL